MSSLEEIPRSEDFTRCYGCGEANAQGLRLRFALDRAAGKVVARWSPPAHFAGYRKMAHGGVIAAMLDEAMGWALWGLEQRFGVTHHLDMRFHRPVLVEREVEILGWVEGTDDAGAKIRAEVRDRRQRLVAEALGEFRFVGGDKIRDA